MSVLLAEPSLWTREVMAYCDWVLSWFWLPEPAAKREHRETGSLVCALLGGRVKLQEKENTGGT